MKRINFIQRPTPVARGSSRATCENSTKRMWGLVVTVSVPSGFSAWCCSESVGWSSVPSRAFVLRSPLELIIMPLLGWQHIPSPSLAGSQTWWPVPPWQKVSIRGQWLNPIQRGQPKDEGHPRATPGFGGYWFIPPLLSKPIFGQPPL